MDRLKSFDGIPHPYDEKKRVVVPAALKALRLKPHRKFSRLGDLSKEFGWKSHAVLSRLEEPQGEEHGVLQEAPRGPEGEGEDDEGGPEGLREGDRFGQEARRRAQPCVNGPRSFPEIATLEPRRPT